MADAFFRFDTDVDQAAVRIRKGMADIAKELQRTRGGKVSVFDPVVEAATRAAAEANRELAKIGNRLAKDIEIGATSGGYRQLQQQTAQVRRQAVSSVRPALEPALDQLGITDAGQRRRAIEIAEQQIRDDINDFYKSIQEAAARAQGMSMRAFLRNEGSTAEQRLAAAQQRENERAARQQRPPVTLTLPDDAQRSLRGRSELTSDLARVGSADTGAKPDPLYTPNPSSTGQKARALLLAEEEAYRIQGRVVDQRREAALEQARDLATDKATRNAINRQLKELRRRQEAQGRVLAREVEEENRKAEQQATYAEVMADPSRRQVGKSVQVTDDAVYRNSPYGLVPERSPSRADQARRDADEADARRLRQEQEAAAKDLRREQEDLARQRSREIERETYDRVTADPTTRQISGNRFIQGTTGQVYNTRGAGLELERNPAREAKAHQDNVRSIEASIAAREKEVRRGSLTQSFVGGLTSSGFGDNATGFDPSGLARSFGTTVKFSAQFAALNGLQLAFADTITQAVDYRDSLTDLNVALGEGNDASAAYVDSLSDISRAAGGNVGQALDAAARGVRAFTDEGASAAETDAAGQQSALQARNLSIITGQTIPDAMGDLVAIGQSFDLQVGALGRVTDAVAAAKQQGGDPLQIAQGLANASVALKEAGFDTAEGAFLISSVIANLNESGQAAATRISRIVSSAGSASGRELFRSLDIDPNQDAKTSLIELAKLYNKTEDETGALTEAQKQQALVVLGGSSNLREFRSALEALELAGFTEGFNTAGKAQDEVARKTGDLAGQLKELGGTIRNVQNELFDSGVFTPFLAALGAVQPLLNTVEDLLKLFNRLGDAVPDFVPDLSVAGIGFQDLLVGIGEVVLARKVLRALRASEVPVITAETAAELNLARARAQGTAAALGENAAAAMGLTTRAASITAINAETAALTANNAAKGAGALGGVDALLPERTRGQRLRDAGSRALNRRDTVRGFDIPTGKIGAGLVTAVVADQVIRSAIGAIDRTSASLREQTDAQKALAAATDAATTDRAVEDLEAAAAARAEASSGFFGTLQNFGTSNLNRLYGLVGADASFGVDAGKDEENLLAASRIVKEQRRYVAEEAKGRDGDARFGAVFGSISKGLGVEGLRSGIEQLDAAGYSATRQVRLLSDALTGVGTDAGPGTVLPGGGRNVGEAVAGSFRELAGEALRDFLRTKNGDDVAADDAAISAQVGRVRAAVQRRKDNQRADPGRDPEESSGAKADKALIKRERKRLKELGEARRTAAAQAAISLDKFNPTTANPKELANLRVKVSDTVQEFIDAALPNGGVLTDQQLNDLATELAGLYVNEGQGGKSLKETRRLMQEKLVERLREVTDPSKLIVDQSTADVVQDIFISKSAGVESDTVLRTGDKVQAIRDRLATTQEGINAALAAGQEVSDNALAEVAQGNLDLAAGLSERAASYDALAAAQLSSDDEVGRAGIAVQTAARNLTEALKRPGDVEAVNAARIADIEARRAEQDARLQAAAAQRSAGVRPGDAVGAANADYLNAVAARQDTDQFGVNGEQNAAYSEALTAEAEALRASLDAQISQMDANRRVTLQAGDVVGEANADLADANTRLLNLRDNDMRFEADGKTETEEYVRTVREVADKTQASIDAQVAQAIALSLATVRAGDALGQARAKAAGSALLLAKTDQFDDNGIQSELFSQRQIEANADAYAEAQANAAARNSADARRVSNADSVGNLRNAVTEARRNTAIERQFGGATEINAALEAEEDALNALAEGLVAANLAMTEGRLAAGDAIGQLTLARDRAVSELALARGARADVSVTGPLQAAARQAQRALDDGVRDAANQRKLNAIDPRDAAARAQEVARQAQETVKRMRRLGDTGIAVEQAVAAAIDAQIAAAQAVIERNSLARRTRIDLTDPLAVAREARQTAEQRLRVARASGVQEEIDRATIDFRESAGNEEQVAFQQRLNQVQTNERLGRITHAAYIDYLNTEKARLEAIANRTFQQQEQLNQVDEALKAANESMQGQFNLGDIRVPTPFEVRRSLAAEGTTVTTMPVGAATPVDPAMRAMGVTAPPVTSAISNIHVEVNGADLVQVKALLLSLIGPQASGRTPVVAGRKI